MNNIKVLRCQSGFSQKSLAEKVGVTQQAVAKWETGDSYPRGEMLATLADLLHCSIDELFGRERAGSAEQSSA